VFFAKSVKQQTREIYFATKRLYLAQLRHFLWWAISPLSTGWNSGGGGGVGGEGMTEKGGGGCG
jgi:hypothetical protein